MYQRLAIDQLTIDNGPITAAQVFDVEITIAVGDLCVVAAHGDVVDDNVTLGMPTDHRLFTVQRNDATGCATFFNLQQRQEFVPPYGSVCMLLVRAVGFNFEP